MLPRTADVVIVGGGLVGCATARALARRGLRAVLIEQGTIGAEASRAAAGLVAPQAECPGPGPVLTAALASRRRYARFAAGVAAESGIDVRYRRDGVVYVALTRPERARLEKRMRWQRAAGLRVERISAREARRLVPALRDDVPFVVFFPDDHRVDNERLAGAIGIAARRAGARVVEHVRGVEVLAAHGRVSGIVTSAGHIATRHVVDAAGAWAASLRLPAGVTPPPVYPVRGQMLVLRSAARTLARPLYSARAYAIPRSDGRVLVGSTLERAGFEKRVTVGAAARLLAAACAMAPSLADATLEGGYAGLRPATDDHVPIVGPAADLPGLTYAAGLYRSGILLGPLVAEAVADQIAHGRTRLPVAGFDPARFARTSTGPATKM